MYQIKKLKNNYKNGGNNKKLMMEKKLKFSIFFKFKISLSVKYDWSFPESSLDNFFFFCSLRDSIENKAEIKIIIILIFYKNFKFSSLIHYRIALPKNIKKQI